jgi:hypothetical protein
MKVPGFTAEASLYEVAQHYRTTSASTSTAAQVLPQSLQYRLCGSTNPCWDCKVSGGRCRCTWKCAMGQFEYLESVIPDGPESGGEQLG